jgi:hypothetical protein
MILLFEANDAQAPGRLELLTDGRRGLKSVSGKPIESLDDVFRAVSGFGFAGPQFLQQVVK